MASAQTLTKPEALDDHIASKPGAAKMSASFVLLALVLYLALDCIARFSYPYWPMDHYNSPNRSWTWWAMRDFRAQKETPEVVLLGSSLMVMALHGGDATAFHIPQNNTLHHKSLLLEQLLNQSLHRNYSTFSFAIAGQMVSDAYSITSCCLDGKQKPNYIIYGIAPRDFMDNTLPNPASTETFKYFSRVSDLSHIAMRARPSVWDRFDYWVGNVSFLYAHRNDILSLQHRYIKLFFAKTHLMDDLNLAHTPIALRKLAMLELPEDNAINEVFTAPYRHDEKYLDNSSEYRARYRQFNHKLFKEQSSYLSDLMNLCDRRGIKLIIVNMPVTAGNVQLMPPGFYPQYLETVKSMTAAHHQDFIDMNDPRQFPDNCFLDSVHLNGKGGVTFFGKLTQELVTTKALTR
ncbi:MAG TPA: hypothetical protein V6C97_36565 [Oculatellaceae cyanobacterium]